MGMRIGFSSITIFLGECSVFYAELWGILNGLILLQRRGYNRGVIQSNSLQTVSTIQGNTSVDLSSALLRQIQQILIHGGQ